MNYTFKIHFRDIEWFTRGKWHDAKQYDTYICPSRRISMMPKNDERPISELHEDSEVTYDREHSNGKMKPTHSII